MSSLTNLFKCVTHSYEDHPMTRFHGCTATWLIHICLLPKPSLIHTGCQRPIDCLIFAGLWKLHTWALYLMADVRSGSFAKRDLQKEVSYGSWSSCEHTKKHTHTHTHTFSLSHTPNIIPHKIVMRTCSPVRAHTHTHTHTHTHSLSHTHT